MAVCCLVYSLIWSTTWNDCKGCCCLYVDSMCSISWATYALTDLTKLKWKKKALHFILPIMCLQEVSHVIKGIKLTQFLASKSLHHKTKFPPSMWKMSMTENSHSDNENSQLSRTSIYVILENWCVFHLKKHKKTFFFYIHLHMFSY